MENYTLEQPEAELVSQMHSRCSMGLAFMPGWFYLAA
jgi:hypothetical protein